MPRGGPKKWGAITEMDGSFFGLHETAKYLGVTPAVVTHWMRRGRVRTLPMPEPIQRLYMGPLWRKMDIVTYKRRLQEHDNG